MVITLAKTPLPACPVAFNRNHGIAPASGASSLVSFLPFTSPDCSDECREWHHCGLSLARSSNRCITGTSLLTWRHNHSTLPRQYTELDRCFMCRRCGAVLTQPTLAVQPGNEGVLSTSPSPEKFTRYYFWKESPHRETLRRPVPR